MARRGDTHRVLRWLWTSRRIDARLARLSLLPAAGLWRGVTIARDAAYGRGWLPTGEPTIPTIGIGNLTVGDSGKTPVMAWIGRHLAAQGCPPGIVLRGESLYRAAEQEHGVPGAIVVMAEDRLAGVRKVAAAGARVAVLEDGFRAKGVSVAYGVAVMAAETSRAVRWPVPAGPWREGWRALADADAVVVTRKRASIEAARALAAEIALHTGAVVAIAHLGVRHFEGLVSRTEHSASALAGLRVVAASGSSDPDAFVGQVKATGAAVQVHTWRADGELRDEDVAWLAHATRRADHLVISQQDAVKLRDRWPARVAEPLVAVLDLTWEVNGDAVAAGIDVLAAPVAPLESP